MDIQTVIFYIGIASASVCLIPFIIGLTNLNNVSKQLIPMLCLLVINIIVEIINIIISKLGLSNHYIFHYFTVAEFTLISLFYSCFFKDYFSSWLIKLLIPVFFIVAYIDSMVNGLNTVNNFSASVESIILIFYSLLFFYFVLKNLIFENLLSTPLFWINTAILFYFSGNLILFVFSNYMATIDPLKLAILWSVIHTFFNVLYNVFLSIGFWKTRVK
ncbi:MAG: hypothetical protein Q8L81_04150 [Bacteroidota bacterium]|nr:hypothetical protein [Bacteroidota bacterium]